jgi:K(+)-stimulated pyrophosphate-energized sodium pump
MNILIKLTCLIGLVLAPILGGHVIADEMNTSEEMMFIDEDGNQTILTNAQANQVKDADAGKIAKEVKVEMSVDGDVTTANVTIETTKDGETTTETKTFSGTEAEVKAQIEALKDVDVNVKGGKMEKEIEVTKKQ